MTNWMNLQMNFWMNDWMVDGNAREEQKVLLPDLADVAKVEEEGAQLLQQALHLQRLSRLLTLTDQQI